MFRCLFRALVFVQESVAVLVTEAEQITPTRRFIVASSLFRSRTYRTVSPLSSLLIQINRGLISLNSNDTYYLEPIGGLDSIEHSLSSADQLPGAGGTCGHGHQTGRPHNLISSLLKPLHQRVSCQTHLEHINPLQSQHTVKVIQLHERICSHGIYNSNKKR